MADFHALVSGAVAKLPENTAAARRALYERVRAMLVRQLQGADPPVSNTEIERELRSLEEVIDQVEAAADTPAPRAQQPAPPEPGPPARPSGGRRVMTGIVAIAIVACVLAGAYFAYARFWSPTGGASIAAVPAGSDAMAIKGVLADYREAADKPSDVILLHVRCGATIVERDAQSNPVNPSGRLDDQGRFSVAVKKAYLGELIKVGVHATAGPADELHQDFLVLGFFAGDKLELLAGADGKTIKISPQGEILNAGAVNVSSAITPPLIVTRRADGNVYASGGALAFDEAC